MTAFHPGDQVAFDGPSGTLIGHVSLNRFSAGVVFVDVPTGRKKPPFTTHQAPEAGVRLISRATGGLLK